ncbi:PREDICTED: poly [ADP-ribose] polymerase-like [Papilio polytes]|uniref:poly [ADP-ribose] polymerase-like n=1 Tax=Papilio polytes TaxID=76194 RepID=UPI0006764285|nr:PREDICTED: poly [ADP-ribose] polymerase-like [Papilio polytes]
MANLPYKVEYAKTGNANCKVCKEKIDKGILRFGMLLQSKFYDGCQIHWHHEECFFKKVLPKSIFDFERFNVLKYDDMKRLNAKIKSMISTTLNNQEKGQIDNNRQQNINETPLLSFSIEYSKTSSSKCRHCDQKIYKDEIRISKSHYDPRFGDSLMWFHVQCFIMKREDHLYFRNIDEMSGFSTINENDQVLINKEIENLSNYLEVSAHDEENSDKYLDMIEGESRLFDHYRKSLSVLNDNELKKLIDTNLLLIPKSREESLDILADCMTCGVPETCPECKQGKIVLDTFYYKCIGDTSAWTQCTYKTETPKKTTMKIPYALEHIPVFKDYRCPGLRRHFCKSTLRTIVNRDSNLFQQISQNTKDEAKKTKLTIKYGMVVDPDSGLENVAHVYKEQINDYSVVLSKTSVDDNKNSFYKLQLLEADSQEKYWVFRSWGRIGTSIGGKKLENFTEFWEAKNHFETIYMQKTKHRELSGHHFIKIPRAYVPVDINYFDISMSKINIESDCNLPMSIQEMIVKIFDKKVIDNCLLQYDLDVDKMPLGKITKEQIKFGYGILSSLLEDFDKGTISMEKIKDSTNKLYTIVPHNFGLKKPPLLDNVDVIKNKLEMLDSLLEVEIVYDLIKSASDDIVSPIESLYLSLNAVITPLDNSSMDYNLVKSYLENTQYSLGYTIEIDCLYQVSRAGEEDRYNKYKELHNKRLLWHGSRTTNIAGILSQGLRIAPPEAPATGYLFGKGIYFADMISKSAHYCFVNKNNSIGFALLCEVALGNSKKCYKAQNVTLPEDIHSVWGVGLIQPNPTEDVILQNVLVPLGTPINSGAQTNLFYNEYIVYDVAQVNIKYLVQLKFNFK